MGATERRVKEREGMRRRILTAASTLIQEEGYKKLTIRRVADRIEHSPMALYNHFPDKDSILKALADEGFGRYLKSLPTRSRLPPIEELRRYLLSYIRFAMKQPEQYRLVFMTPRRVPNVIEPNGDHTLERYEDAYACTCITPEETRMHMHASEEGGRLAPAEETFQ